MNELDFSALDKQALVQSIMNELHNIKDIAFVSAEQARLTATHSENVAESRYDTLGLEGAYLAHGQTQRVVECDEDIIAFKDVPLIILSHADKVNLGALVLLEGDNKAIQYLYLTPRAGGVKVEYQNCIVTLVTPLSPIGKALLGKRLGDEVQMPVSGSHKYFTIANLI